jgi:hypothetical protein
MTQLSPNLNSAPVTVFQNVAAASAGNAQQGSTVLGAMITGEDGREFRWCYAGSTTLVAGNLQQSPAQIANHINLVVVQAQAIGDTQITVTLGGTAATANQYAGGYAQVYTSTGAGLQYSISSHPAQATTTGNLTLNLSDPILVAITTSSTVSLVLNPYNGVIVNPISATGAPVGVAHWALPTATYGWIQTHGVANVLNDAGTTVGLGLAPSAGTAGAVKTMAATLCQVGYALQTGTSTDYCAAFLTM